MKSRYLLRILLTMTIGCAANAEDEPEASSEEALSNSPSGSLQIYSMNTHHMSQPGTSSFEATDWRQMVSYIHEQKYVPDIVMLSEIGRHNAVPSQPCNVFVHRLEKVLSPKGRLHYKCETAKGSPDSLDNAGGGTAVVYRENLVPLEKKVLVNWVLKDDKCIPDPTGPGLTFIQTFRDGKHTVAVASLHLVSGTDEGATNQYGRDCSEKNLQQITDALDHVKADAKVFGGDMNHSDAQRHMDGANVVHDHWESGYAFVKKAGWKDAWFDDCSTKCAATPTDQCISSCLATTTSFYRIDWVLAKGAHVRDNVSIPFEEAHDAYVRETGDANAVPHYSDHHAQRITVSY